MSRLGKALLVFAGIALLAAGVTRLFLGEWETKMLIPLGLCVLSLAVAIAKDAKFYKELMLMRTTRHGLNLGTLVLLVLASLGAINFIASRHNKKWDLTDEKLNSLSEQTIGLVKKLDKELEIKGFFTENRPEDEQARAQFRQLTKMLEDESSKVRVALINPLKKPEIAKAYKVDMAGIVVLKIDDKQTTITDLTEEAFANAIVKLTRGRNKVVYVLEGHGELLYDESEKEAGAGRFIKALQDSSYSTAKLSLVQTGEVPKDADALAILGGTQPLLDSEVTAILNYAASGGHLFIAMDPGKRHNLADLVKRLGIQFGGDYIIDQLGQLSGLSAAVAIGTEFSKTSDLTKNFVNVQSGLLLASPLKRAEGASPDIRVEEIVKTSPASFSKKEIAGKIRADESDPRGPFAVVMTAQGKGKALLPSGSEDKEFSAVVFSSSSIASNQFFDTMFPINRDLALNSVSFLAKDTDLISVRPKEPKGTRLIVTRTNKLIVILGFFIPIPFILFATSGVVWMRRRGA
jgi:ABC-type uncharacterized transport system involved in gliding motility auxiliary subunit